MRITIIIAITFVLIGCASLFQSNESLFITNFSTHKLLPLDSFKEGVTATYQIKATYQDKQFDMIGVLKISSSEIHLIVLTELIKLFTVHYNKDEMHMSASVLVPDKAKKPKYIISDIQLTYYPLKELERYLPSSLEVSEEIINGNRVRTFTQKEVDKIVIIYYGDDLFEDDISYINYEREYTFFISRL